MPPTSNHNNERIDPLVSVVVNCFNGAKYLEKAIESILVQTYQNWEVIFWDNQSTDGSAQIYKRYEDPRLKYYYAPDHTLLYEARNRALEHASGEFIAFLDADDWWEPEKLAKQIPLFTDNKVGLVYGNYWLVNERKNKPARIMFDYKLPVGKVLNTMLENYVVGMLTMVVRRCAFDELGKGFDTRFQILGDFDLAVRLAKKWEFDCVQDPVSSYRWHGNNLSILDSRRSISETELWCDEMQRDSVVRLQSGLKSVVNRLLYMKIVSAIMCGHKRCALSLLHEYPYGLVKLKLSIALCIPVSLLKAMRA